MAVLRIDHAVRDFDAWKQTFDSDPVGRQTGGVQGYRILRPAGEPNSVLVDLDFESTSEAEAFAERLRALWVEAGPRLGLESPTARVLETVETHTY
jgi:hypothetical protein